jgi:hypothetical protein
MPRITLSLLAALLLTACGPQSTKPAYTAGDLHQWNRVLLNTVMEDLFPPMIASRVYTYPQIAAWLASAPPSQTKGFAEVMLREFGTPPGAPVETYDPTLAAFTAWSGVASKLVFSEHYISDLRESELQQAQALDETVRARSQAYGEAIAAFVLERASRDAYTETRTYSRWTPTQTDSTWWQTPPDYPTALEPHWGKIHPLILDSARVCKAPAPIPFSKAPESAFYDLAVETMSYWPGKDPSTDATAWYWDDNPNDYENVGHNTRFLHKYSPAGHWMHIAAAACKQKHTDFAQSAEIMAIMTMAQFDGFIVCWNDKYTTDRIRPITFIQAHIDPEWMSLIQTPGFPEYPSGHSVVSAASAEVLTHYFGEPFQFTDSTEYSFGLGVRTFPSFREAAKEAGFSRLYGGIHYRDGIEEGLNQGECIGQTVINRLNKTVNP